MEDKVMDDVTSVFSNYGIQLRLNSGLSLGMRCGSHSDKRDGAGGLGKRFSLTRALRQCEWGVQYPSRRRTWSQRDKLFRCH